MLCVKYIIAIEINWSIEYEAEDEGYALMEADADFNFMSEARATEITYDEDAPQS